MLFYVSIAKNNMAPLQGLEPRFLVLETNVLPLHYRDMASGEGVEPPNAGVKVPCAYLFHHPDIGGHYRI